MQVTATEIDGLRRRYTITVTAAELDARVQQKLAEAQPEIEMKGFRKGRVPMPLLRKQFGPRLLGDAMQEALDGAMKSHFEATGERPALQPDIKMLAEDWKEGQDLVVSMAYEALPEVPEVDFSSIALERLVVPAAPEAVEEAIARLAAGAGAFAPKAEGAAAEAGDEVVIDFVGRIDGETFEGGSGEGVALELGAERFLPGFEAQLVGAVAGEVREVAVTFPADYRARHLAGRDAAFTVTVREVRARQPAAVDDALAERFGARDLADLRAQVAARIEAEYRTAARAVLKRALLDALDARVSFDLPPSLVEAEARQIAHQLWHEDHPDHPGHDHPEIAPTEEHQRLAVRRVRLGLLLAEVGRRAGIGVSDAEMSQAVMAQARQYPGQERAFVEFVQKNPGVQQQIRAPIYEDKVVDHILSLAALTERPATREELQKAIDALDEV